MSIVTFVIKTCFFRLTVDVRLIALIAMPLIWCISTVFERETIADHASVKHVTAREKSGNLVQHICMHNRWRGPISKRVYF